MKGLSLEAAIGQHTKFNDFIDKYIEKSRANCIKSFFGERELTLTSSPYSPKSDGVGCYPGGYIVMTNRLIEAALILEKVWERFIDEKTYSTEELVVSAIFCEVGKLGTNDEPFFIKNDNDWEVKNRGLLYKYNPLYSNLKYSDSAIFLLQNYSIKLSENEFLGIKLYNTQFDTENNHYFKWENKLRSNLPYIINQAYQLIQNTK